MKESLGDVSREAAVEADTAQKARKGKFLCLGVEQEPFTAWVGVFPSSPPGKHQAQTSTPEERKQGAQDAHRKALDLENAHVQNGDFKRKLPAHVEDQAGRAMLRKVSPNIPTKAPRHRPVITKLG